MKESDVILRNSKNSFTKLKIFDDSKVGCVFLMVINSTLPGVEFGPNDRREYALHSIFEKSTFANSYFFREFWYGYVILKMYLEQFRVCKFVLFLLTRDHWRLHFRFLILNTAALWIKYSQSINYQRWLCSRNPDILENKNTREQP